MPLGEEYGGATYFLLETHYDNPSMHQNILDSSGIIQILGMGRVSDFWILLGLGFRFLDFSSG